jgi:hypothetical protein
MKNKNIKELNNFFNLLDVGNKISAHATDSTVDNRAPESNYLPFDEKIGKVSDYPDTKDGRKKMFKKLLELRKKYNPVKIESVNTLTRI